MEFSIFFVILMVILSGFIAYFGDLLGRKMGKKRLTIGKLRPRHTAAIFTGISGAMATLVVILILSSISTNIRTWILQGNRAQEELKKTQTQLTATNLDLTAKTDEIGQLQGDIISAQNDLAEAESKISDAEKYSKELEREAAGLNSDIEELTENLVNLEADLTSLRTDFESLESEQVELQAINATLSQHNKEYSDHNLELIGDNEELENRLKQLDADIKRLTSERNGLESELAEAQKVSAEALAKQRAELEDVNSKLATAQTDLSELNDDLEEAQDQLRDARIEIFASKNIHRSSELLTRLGDELVRMPVGPSLTEAEAMQKLSDIMQLASDYARGLGASIVTGQPDEYVAFPVISFPNRPPVSGSDQAALAVTAMTGQRQPLLIIARSLFNSFKGEYIPLQIEVRPNPVVYRADEEIASTVIDGSLGNDSVAKALEVFLLNQVRIKVLQRGVIPAVGKDLSVGELSRESVLRLVQEVVDADRRVKVTFFAINQTRAGDQLLLGFRVQ